MIVICGSSGFIGSELKQHLPNVTEVSLRKTNWEKTIEKSSIVINLVGLAHDHNGIFSTEDYYHVNLNLTKKIYYEFVKSEAKLLIQISSIAALEEFTNNLELDENFESNSISDYGKSKREAEKWLLDQKLKKGKKVIILRPPMVHGPGDKGNLNLLVNIVKARIPYPLGKFDNLRSFIYIENLVFYINEILKNSNELETGIYHISDNEPLSTKQIIREIGDLMGIKVIILYIPKGLIKFFSKIGDAYSLPLNSKRLTKLTSNLIVSNKKINKILNIKNLPYSAQDGLRKTIKSMLTKK